MQRNGVRVVKEEEQGDDEQEMSDGDDGGGNHQPGSSGFGRQPLALGGRGSRRGGRERRGRG